MGNPLAYTLTAAQAADITQGPALLHATLAYTAATTLGACQFVICDKGYDAAAFRQLICDAGAEPVIPYRKNARNPHPIDTHLYKERNLIERFVNRIKQYRRLATRYDKLAATYLGFLHLVSALIWLR